MQEGHLYRREQPTFLSIVMKAPIMLAVTSQSCGLFRFQQMIVDINCKASFSKTGTITHVLKMMSFSRLSLCFVLQCLMTSKG